MIEYKGNSFRLEAVGGGSKLAGAVKRRAIVGDPDLLVGSATDLLEQLDAKWTVADSPLWGMFIATPMSRYGCMMG